MNQAPGGQGQPGPQQGDAQQGDAQHGNQQKQQQRSNLRLYRPDDLNKFTAPFLTDTERTKYKDALRGMWQMFNQSQANSEERAVVQKKIHDFGVQLEAKMRARQVQLQAQQQQQAQGQQPQGLQQQGKAQKKFGDGQKQEEQLNMAQPQQHSGVAITMQQGHGPPKTGANNAAAPTQMKQGLANAVAAAPAQSKISPQIWQRVESMKITIDLYPAAHMGDKATEQDKVDWVAGMKNRCYKALLKIEQAKAALASLQQTVREQQATATEQDKKSWNAQRTMIQKQQNEAVQFLQKIGTLVQGTQIGRPNGQPSQQLKPGQCGPSGGGAAGAGPGGGPNNAAAPGTGSAGAPSNHNTNNGGAIAPMQSSTAAVNAAIEAAKNQQLAAGSYSRVPPNGQVPPESSTIQSMPPQAQPRPNNAPASQPPVNIKIEPGTQSQPSVQVPAPASSAISIEGTPTQQNVARAAMPTPQARNLQQPLQQGAQPLSHNVANDRANDRANLMSTQRANSMPGSGGPGSASTPLTTSASVMGSIGGPHSQYHSLQQSGVVHASQIRFPIKKELTEAAMRPPLPVAVLSNAHATRPTMSGGGGLAGGVMGLPAIQKLPPYYIEGDGDRVLSKRKLDELMRQVSGGTAEGQEGTLLSPEVEESVLSLADSFVDDVLHKACRNAKERGSRVLETRDLQLVLERTYNIRIPGYSSDELRTTRKIQPTAQWYSKISAVAAAKMTDKGEP